MRLTYTIYCGLVVLVKLGILTFMFTSPKALDEYSVAHQLMFYSTWMFIAQILFFLFEFFASLVEESTTSRLIRRYMINLIFTPSLIVLTYFFLIIAFNWTSKYSDDTIMIIVNLGMHGFNVINLTAVVFYSYPFVGKLHNNYRQNSTIIRRIRNVAPYFLAFVIPLFYWIIAILYSNQNEKLIYPTNMFSFQKIEGKKSYAVETILIVFYLTIVLQASFTYLCNRRLQAKAFDTEIYL